MKFSESLPPFVMVTKRFASIVTKCCGHIYRLVQDQNKQFVCGAFSLIKMTLYFDTKVQFLDLDAVSTVGKWHPYQPVFAVASFSQDRGGSVTIFDDTVSFAMQYIVAKSGI